MSEIHSTCPPEENEAHQSDSSSSYDDLSDSSSEIDTSDLDESAIEAKSTRQAEILAQMDNGETPTSPDPSEVSRDKTAEIVAQAMVDAGLADEQHYAMVGKSSQNLHLAEEIQAVQDRGADNLSCSMMSSPAESQFGAVVRRLTQSSVGQFFNQLTHAEGINQRRPKGDAFRQIDPGCFFDDGKRVIDYVLVYPLKRVRSKKAQQRDLELRKFRKAFEDKLIDIGLDVERVGVERSQDGKTCCVKLHATWDFMTRQAELMQLKAPIQRRSNRNSLAKISQLK